MMNVDEQNGGRHLLDDHVIEYSIDEPRRFVPPLPSALPESRFARGPRGSSLLGGGITRIHINCKHK